MAQAMTKPPGCGILLLFVAYVIVATLVLGLWMLDSTTPAPSLPRRTRPPLADR